MDLRADRCRVRQDLVLVLEAARAVVVNSARAVVVNVEGL